MTHALVHMNESCPTYTKLIHIYEWVKSHIYMSTHDIYMNSRLIYVGIYECVISKTYESYIRRHMSHAHKTYTWGVDSHTLVYMNVSYQRLKSLTYTWIADSYASYIWMCHIKDIWVLCTSTYESRTYDIYMNSRFMYVAYMNVSYQRHMSDMTLSYMLTYMRILTCTTTGYYYYCTWNFSYISQISK